MSGGRYSFVATGDSDSRRVRAGLGLQILDDYFSGHTRSTRTLSGGESFMASLSLALGLAVAAAEAVRRAAWKRSSSTRDSAASTLTRSTSSWTRSTTCAPVGGSSGW